MKLRNFAIQALALLVCLVATGQTRKTTQGKTRKPAALPDYKNPNLPIQRRVRDLLGRMTLEEKARQLDMYSGIPDLVDKSMDKTHAAPCPQGFSQEETIKAIWLCDSKSL